MLQKTCPERETRRTLQELSTPRYYPTRAHVFAARHGLEVVPLDLRDEWIGSDYRGRWVTQVDVDGVPFARFAAKSPEVMENAMSFVHLGLGLGERPYRVSWLLPGELSRVE